MLPNYVTPPRHVLDGAAQGSELLARECWHGMVAFTRQPYECMSREGLMGLPKGVILGSYDLTRGVADGTLDLVSNLVEGIRNTPDTVANAMLGEDRPHWKYGIDGEEGRILETHLQRPSKQVLDGAMQGTKAVTTGITCGVVDLIAKPIDTIHTERTWTAGIAKGVGQGLVGLTAKTAAGVLDLTDAVTDGLRHTPGWVADEIAELRGFGRDAPVKREFVGGGGAAHPGPGVSHRYWDCLQNPGTGRQGALHPGVRHLQQQATASGGSGWGAQTTQQTQFWAMVQEQQEADAAHMTSMPSGSVTYRGPLQAGLSSPVPAAQAARPAGPEQGAPLLSVLPPGAAVSRAPSVHSAPPHMKVPSYAPSVAFDQPAMHGAHAMVHQEPWMQAPVGFYRLPVGGEGGLAQRWRG